MHYRLRALLIVSVFLLMSREAYAGPQTIPPIGGPNLLVLFFLFCVGMALTIVALVAGLPIWLGLEIRKAKKQRQTERTSATRLHFAKRSSKLCFGSHLA
jgi:hypothetical protein